MQSHSSPRCQAFTLVEIVVVIAIIGIMTSLVITVYRNVAQDSRDVVARQQQAALQSAISNWVTVQAASNPMTLVRADYNGTTTASNSLARLNKIKDYLDERTHKHFIDNTTENDKILSAALKRLNKYIQLSSWTAGSYPQVEMKSN